MAKGMNQKKDKKKPKKKIPLSVVAAGRSPYNTAFHSS